MSPSRLTPRDTSVIQKIQDPESAASPQLIIDNELPRDPNIKDEAVYASIQRAEKDIMAAILKLETGRINRLKEKGYSLAGPGYSLPDRDESTFPTEQTAGWLSIIMKLDKLIEKYPNYASARNNRVQAVTAVYGEGLLVRLTKEAMAVNDDHEALVMYATTQDATLEQLSRKILGDLRIGIDLLTSQTVFAAMSPTQAKTLSQLHMQRGNLYRVAAQKLARDGEVIRESTLKNTSVLDEILLRAEFRIKEEQKEAAWSSVEFEEQASRDFQIAGWYGNEIGKALAVATNPNAKLCGQIVSEAMKKEFGGVDTTT